MNMLCNTTSCGHFKHSCPWSLAPVKLPFLQGKILAMHSSVAVGLTSNQELTTVEFPTKHSKSHSSRSLVGRRVSHSRGKRLLARFSFTIRMRYSTASL